MFTEQAGLLLVSLGQLLQLVLLGLGRLPDGALQLLLPSLDLLGLDSDLLAPLDDSDLHVLLLDPLLRLGGLQLVGQLSLGFLINLTDDLQCLKIEINITLV